MIVELLILALISGPGPTAPDTLVQLHQGDRLTVPGFRGELRIESWTRPEMSVRARDAEDAAVHLERDGRGLRLTVTDLKGRGRKTEVLVTVPPWLDVEVTGREFEAWVRGLEGTVRLANLDGDLTLEDLSGSVTASTVEGEIVGSELSGSARLSSGDDDVVLAGCSGSIVIETVDGDITMREMRSREVTAGSTDGDVIFGGRLEQGGEYRLRTHDGDLTLLLTPPVDVAATVVAYDGEFESDFPVRIGNYETGKGFDFTLGAGTARLTLETFSGEIRLRNRDHTPDR